MFIAENVNLWYNTKNTSNVFGVNIMDFKSTYLGIEFGSTRIKAVLCDSQAKVLAQGSYSWENMFENGHWTYPDALFTEGMSDCYNSLLKDIKEKYNEIPTTFGAIGISGMMHGYVALDKDYKLLVPFRTWRDTTTFDAADELTQMFNENIPLRWSISHLYQAVLNKEEHLSKLAHITTLSGYIHYLLTGENNLGIGDASGMFPLLNGRYNPEYISRLDNEIAKKGYNLKTLDVLPNIVLAGKVAGHLTEQGAALLDSTGNLKSGIPFCAPEGDAATGMVAVNAVTMGEGSVSAGTSAFAMLVVPNKPSDINRDVDLVSTPDGKDVAMIHVNNCCGELDAWVNLFDEFSKLSGNDINKGKIYDLLYENTLNSSEACGGISAYNFISAEPIIDIDTPCPSILRNKASMSLADFFKAQIYGTVSALAIGVEDFKAKEKVSITNFKASGGIFKTPKIAQQIYADALGCPVTLAETAGEGGAWGMAILALYLQNSHMPFDKWLNEKIFVNSNSTTLNNTEKGKKDFEMYISNYKEKLHKYFGVN